MFPNLSSLRLEKVACKTAIRGWGEVPSPWLANSRRNEYHSRGGGGDGLSAADRKLLEDAKEAKAQRDKLIADAKEAKAQRDKLIANAKSAQAHRKLNSKNIKALRQELNENIAKIWVLQRDADEIASGYGTVLARLELMTKRDEVLEKRMETWESMLKEGVRMLDQTNSELLASKNEIERDKIVDDKRMEELTKEVGAQKAYVSRLAEIIEKYVAAVINDEEVYDTYGDDPSEAERIPQKILPTNVVEPQIQTSDSESPGGLDADSESEGEEYVEDDTVDTNRPPIQLTGYLAPASSTFSNLDDAASLGRLP